MSLFLKTNGETLVTNKKGYLPGYGDVWYHKKAITNILGLNNVKKTDKVTSDIEDQMVTFMMHVACGMRHLHNHTPDPVQTFVFMRERRS